MPKLSEQTNYVSVLYYGINGTGKTTNLAHLAKLGEVNYLAADNTGLKARPLRDLGVPVDQIEVITEYDPAKLEAYCWQWLEHPPSGGVVLDTLSELVTRRIEHHVDAGWLKVKAAAGRRREEADESLQFATDRDYYNTETQELTRIIRHLNDLPCHLGIAAQIRRDIDEDSGKVTYGPDANPALAGSVMGYVDIIMRLEIDGTWPNGEMIHVGRARPTENYRGKDQYHVLPGILVEPTFDRIIGYVEGTLTKDTDPRQAEYREHKLAQRRPRRTKSE